MKDHESCCFHMPRADAGEDVHRCKRPMATFGMPAAVARPVNRKEMEKNQRH